MQECYVPTEAEIYFEFRKFLSDMFTVNLDSHYLHSYVTCSTIYILYICVRVCIHVFIYIYIYIYIYI